MLDLMSFVRFLRFMADRGQYMQHAYGHQLSLAQITFPAYVKEADSAITLPAEDQQKGEF